MYNDVYGFENGDRVLQFLARIIEDCVSNEFKHESFIGHIGGDDFVVIIENYDVERIISSIIKSFQKGINDFYNEEDIKRKFLFAKNRRGIEEQFGIVTISIAGISNEKRKFRDIYELSECASKVKVRCKSIWDHCFCME